MEGPGGAVDRTLRHTGGHEQHVARRHGNRDGGLARPVGIDAFAVDDAQQIGMVVAVQVRPLAGLKAHLPDPHQGIFEQQPVGNIAQRLALGRDGGRWLWPREGAGASHVIAGEAGGRRQHAAQRGRKGGEMGRAEMGQQAGLVIPLFEQTKCILVIKGDGEFIGPAASLRLRMPRHVQGGGKGLCAYLGTDPGGS